MPSSAPPKNLLLILSDEHNPKVMGCAGHPDVQTPHLDRLAAGGVRYANASCSSPICVPARASLATGRHLFEMGYWDNVDAYDGRTPSWHHILRSQGHEVVSIGKLHYRGWEGDDYGFSESLLPMHIHGGRGEVKMLLRNPPASIGSGANMLSSAKAGESDYTRYDSQITQRAVEWIQAHGRHRSNKPWVLMVSLVAPHFPLTAPPAFYALYADKLLQRPKAYQFGIDPQAHPFVRQYAEQSGYNLHFKCEDDVQRALCGYYGLVSYLDSHVGILLDALASSGLTENTRVMYTSDHGDNTGSRGLWGKSTMYTESVGVPMILSGPDIEAGRVEPAAVGHIDVYNTVLQAVGLEPQHSTASPGSRSLLGPIEGERVTFSEYHTVGSRAAVFMVQDAHTKYVHYCDHPPELFDLDHDPEELVNLANHPDHQARVAHWAKRLRSFCDPDEVDRRAKQRQRALIDFFGGEDAIRAGQGIGGYTPSPVS